MTRQPQSSANHHETPHAARTILGLRLLLARAANQDSLARWDDESLTTHVGFLLERIFPMAPALVACSLALRAVLARQQAACGARDKALHLYRLDRYTLLLPNQQAYLPLVLRQIP